MATKFNQRLEIAAFILCVIGLIGLVMVMLIIAFIIAPRETSRIFIEKLQDEPDMRHPLNPRRTTNHPSFWGEFGNAMATISAEIEKKKARKKARAKNKRKKAKKK
jgi:hypothetical protein